MLKVCPPQILDTATALFQQHGFDNVTLYDIAEAADVSLTQLTDDHHNTAHIALALYRQLGHETLDKVETLPNDGMAQRYYLLLERKLEQLTPHEDTLSALFGYAMRQSSDISAADLSPGQRDPMMQSIQAVVNEANNAPKKQADADELVLLLYTFHFLMLLFWVYDRTENKQATHLFTAFLRDFFKMLRPMMVMPMVGSSMKKMARIMMLSFGGARLASND